jgi:alpha-beta hydrolase superfamily lysophospholipase
MSIRAGTLRWIRRAAAGAAVLFVALLAIRAYDVQRGPALRPWHTEAPPELSAEALATADWDAWMAAEARAFEAVRREVTAKLDAADRVPANRFFADSPLNPSRFATDWNRSFILAPQGAPRGAVVMLHGMTDAPFSMRHLAALYRAQGWLVVVPRMPGHGTVPAGLAQATWEEWVAATRLAVRTARARAGEAAPLHLVGYSNGGALAMKHALDAIDDPRLGAPARIVLVSPMIGVTAFARFAGLAGLPALLPAFAGAAWLDLLPEFNPFKYNSFPVNAARQSYELTLAVQEQTRRVAAAGQLSRLAPVLTFQSAVDATVSTEAVLSGLYAHLPANGSELVLFDINRHANFGPLVTAAATASVERLLPTETRRFRVTVVSNADPGSAAVVARATAAGGVATEVIPLGLAWPREVFSLSHIALPFPLRDGLYGLTPDPADALGINLGGLALRGERGVLVLGMDSLLRVSSNPFFDYIEARIGEAIAAAGTPGAAMGHSANHAARSPP